MAERMQEFLDRTRAAAATMGTAAKAAAHYAGKKTGDAVGAARLNVRALELERECNGLLRDIGEKVYDSLRTGEDHSDFLEERMDELEKRQAQIERLREQAAALRDVKACPACGKHCGLQDQYCKHCGAVL